MRQWFRISLHRSALCRSSAGSCSRPRFTCRRLASSFSSRWPPGSGVFSCTRTTFLTCEELGVLLAMDKVEGSVVSLIALAFAIVQAPCWCRSHMRLPRFVNCSGSSFLQVCTRRADAGVAGWVPGSCYQGVPSCLSLSRRASPCAQRVRPRQPRRLNVTTRADLAWWHSLLSY